MQGSDEQMDSPSETKQAVQLLSETPVESDSDRRLRKAFLASQRGELLSPLHAIGEICERLLSDTAIERPDEFVSDLQVMQSAGHDLVLMIEDVLSESTLDTAASAGDLNSVRSHVRHDMLNKLNPIINYSEMWLEDDDEPSLEAVVPDLKMLYKCGKRCLGLIDQILDSWDVESVDLADFQVGMIVDAVDRMFEPAAESKTADITGHLLVVDDNQTNREILQRRLETYGHRISAAEDGMQALDMLGQGDFDLVLLDIVMPEMDGFDVLLRMKSDEQLRDIPVIMISALDEMDIVVRCIESGAEDYLPKPFNPVLLKARIDACLEKRALHEREVEYLQKIEQEKQRADELLHVILPTEIVAELKSTNAVVPRRYENVAVLFADLVNFTSYCDRNPAEEVVERLQTLVVEWENAALSHRVEKIKTIGDSFMAAGGLLKPTENPVLQCIRCGLDMIEATERLVDGWELRVGIHCGPVVAGVLGQRQYLFDLWGDTVNTAARVESHGVPGAVALSTQAWDAVAEFSSGTSLGSVPVKGKGMLTLYQFDGFNDTTPAGPQIAS